MKKYIKTLLYVGLIAISFIMPQNVLAAGNSYSDGSVSESFVAYCILIFT